jgi:hypothetical protein
MNASYSLAANLANDLTFATLRHASFQFILVHTLTVFYYYLDGKGQDCQRSGAASVKQNALLDVKKMTNGKQQNKPKNEQDGQHAGKSPSLLVGYVRKSNAGGALKVSVNTSAFSDCNTYTTSDGQSYVPLVISMAALRRVMDGERSVTTISHLLPE